MELLADGPFDEILGLPVHPLVVHAVVVLIPVAALGLIAMVVSQRFSQRFGIVVVAASVAATGAAFVAKEAGQELAKRVGEPAHNHEALGQWMPWFALALTAATVAMWLFDRSYDAQEQESRRTVRTALAVVSVVVAVASMLWVFRVGDSGARSVWEGVSDLEPVDD